MKQSSTEIRISEASYGKEGVRALVWVPVGADTKSVGDVSIALQVEGAFLASYRRGDNSAVLPSDTLRRHALAECALRPNASVEDLVERVAKRILDANPALATVTVRAEVRPWERVGAGTYRRMPWRGVVDFRLRRGEPARLSSGLSGLDLLTTAGSSFTGFMRDGLTTQAEAVDRPLCGTLDAAWTYVEGVVARRRGLAEELAARLQAEFVGRRSNAIQQLLTEVATVVLAATPELGSLALHFIALPATPMPAEFNGLDDVRAYEIGPAPLGVTDVTVCRPGASSRI